LIVLLSLVILRLFDSHHLFKLLYFLALLSELDLLILIDLSFECNHISFKLIEFKLVVLDLHVRLLDFRVEVGYLELLLAEFSPEHL
jgi:hypothetical protein